MRASASVIESPGGGSGDGAVAVGDREDRAVVGERARGGHQPVAVGGGAQALEPGGGHDGVGVDDHHVGRRGVAEGGVHVADEAEVLARGGRTPAATGAPSQPLGERLDVRVGAGVVGDDHAGPGRRVLDHAAQALLEQLARPVDRDDHDRLAAAHSSVLKLALELLDAPLGGETLAPRVRRCRACRAAPPPAARRSGAPAPREPPRGGR